MFRKILALLVAALLISLIAGCNGESGETGEITPIKLVPQKANMIGQLNLGQILDDADITGLYTAVSGESELPQTLDEALDRFEEEIGFDLRDIEGGVFFGDISDTIGDDFYFGVIVEMPFEKGDLIAVIEEAADIELNPVDYKGYEIYTDRDQEGAIAFLSDEAFVFGAVEVIEDVIDVNEGDQAAVSDKVLDMYDDLGDALVKVAVTVPLGLAEEGLPEALGELPLGIDLSAFSDMETAGLALDKTGQTIALDLQLCFTNSESAEKMEGLISSLSVLIGMIDLPEEARGFASLLENLDVSRSESCVDIVFEITTSEVEALIESSGDMLGQPL